MQVDHSPESAEKRLEAKLQAVDIRAEVQHRFSYGFEHAAIGMMVTTIMGDLVDVNETFCAMLGRRRRQLLRPGALLALAHEDDRPLCSQWGHEAVFDGRDVFNIELRYRHRDGHWVHCAVTSRSVRDDEGDVLYFFTQALDITQLKAAQEQLGARAKQLEKANAQLAHADQMKTRFLAMTSHDLRNPLTVIRGFTSLLENGQVSEEQHAHYLDVISQQTDRLDRMMEDLLIVSRLESGVLRPVSESICLDRFARRVLDHMQLDVPFELTGDDNVQVEADPEHLERVIVNLATNAVKYGRAPYELRVEASGRLLVCDRGDGVPEDFVADLFEAFSRSNRAAKSDAPGTGLGLMIVKGLVEAMHGTLSYEHADGITSFCVQLPKAAT
jgi:PAS domain S-box-containing protein